MSKQVAFTFSPNNEHVEYSGSVIRNDADKIYTERHQDGIPKSFIAAILPNETEEQQAAVKQINRKLLPLRRKEMAIERSVLNFEKETRKKYHPLKFFFNTQNIADEALEFFDENFDCLDDISAVTTLFLLGGFEIASDEFELKKKLERMFAMTEYSEDNGFYVIGQRDGKGGKFLRSSGNGNLVVTKMSGFVAAIPFDEIAAVVKSKGEYVEVINRLATFAVNSSFAEMCEYTLALKEIFPDIDGSNLPFSTPEAQLAAFEELSDSGKGTHDEYPRHYMDNIELHVYALLKRKYDPHFQHMKEDEAIAHFAK